LAGGRLEGGEDEYEGEEVDEGRESLKQRGQYAESYCGMQKRSSSDSSQVWGAANKGSGIRLRRGYKQCRISVEVGRDGHQG
jgi:hypothetical protein